MQISLNFEIVIELLVGLQRSGSKTVLLFYYFNFERNYEFLKSKSRFVLLIKNINFNKNETKSNMENPTHSFRETDLMLQLI